MAEVVKGMSCDWEIVVGLEVHAQVLSNSKLFSGASASTCAVPNTQVALLDVAMPGTLPVVNHYCISQAVKTAIALSCKVSKYSVFDRKNYFYPDLPLGYQITQFYHPIAEDGYITLDESAEGKKVRIARIHLEQDAGKSVHVGKRTCIDFNRAGVALMEIVTEPDIRSPEEAAEYLKKLRMILRYIGTCSGDMEDGALRCDANVSVRKVGDSSFGTRSEIKNLNSIKYVAQAIRYEAHKQVEAIEGGQNVERSTLLYDADTGTTRTMRDKEDVCDYRYFPDPDLLPIRITDEFISDIRASVPELPEEKMSRYMKDFMLSKYDAGILSSDRDISEYFDNIVKKGLPANLASSWIMGELFRALNKRGIDIASSPVSADDLYGLLDLMNKGVISGKIAKQVFAEMFETKRSALAIVEENGLRQIDDVDLLRNIVEGVIERSPDEVLLYKNGKVKLLGYFVGQVMQETKGKANPEMVNALVKEGLNRIQ